ncbi:MAG: hypothetical protein HOQ01_12150 [Lysobacter sp.]|nr:hypothetical protein [Lysobacter sp.]
MNEQAPPPKKPERGPVLGHVPAILTGAAALIASLTAVYVNLRNDRAPQPAPVAQEAPHKVEAPATKPDAPKPVDRWTLTVDRIAVEHDGSPGTTDWRFTVEADDDALFAFPQDDLDDTGGRNVAHPKDASGTLRLDGRPGARITIKGWRGRLLGTLGQAPDAVGEGRMGANGTIGAIRVEAKAPEEGAFVFHLSADAAR